jgi:AbrB family looped-hinge helix DNA binding protein
MSSKTPLLVSRRGQITLPADLRKRLGIKEGGVMIVEERRGELILRPAAVLELDTYPDAEIAHWAKGVVAVLPRWISTAVENPSRSPGCGDRLG